MPPCRANANANKCNKNNQRRNKQPVNNNTSHFIENYPQKVLSNLNNMRLGKFNHFCDVEIIAEDNKFKAHRAILASCSPYFHAMFTSELSEKNQTSVELHTISATILETLINFIYTGEVAVTEANVQELIVAADMLQIFDVVDACTEFLINELHPINAVGIYQFAEDHNCTELANAARKFIEVHFLDVCREKEIYDLPKDLIIQFLSSEHLCVDSEYQVFQTALRWLITNPAKRKCHVFEIFKHVRLPLVSLDLLENSIVDCNDGSLRVALKSVHDDLVNSKGCLVSLLVEPRLRAKKYIFVIGGLKREPHEEFHHRRPESNYVSVQRFDTYKRIWCKAPDLSINRMVPGVASLNGKIYVVGGEHDSHCMRCGECFDPIENKWTKIARMKISRCEFGMCAVDGFLYALGGWIGHDIGNTIERYDPVANTWKYTGVLPKSRFSMGVVSYEGLIYIVGGCSTNERYLQDLLCYDPKTMKWKCLPPMSVGRSQMGVAVLDDHLYVVGGDSRHQALDSVEKYSFKKKKWSGVPTMRIARSRPAVAAIDGLLYVIGGAKTKENFYRSQYTISAVECYDPRTKKWCDCPELPESRAESGAAVA